MEGVKQIFTDKQTGNQGRLPMNTYMANLQIGMSCLDDPHPYNMVNYALRNMDPAVKKKLLATYTGYRVQRALDPFTQTKAILDLAAHADIAEEEVKEMI